MKHKSIFLKTTFALIAGFMLFTTQLNAQKYGTDVIVRHLAGRYYSAPKISVAYDQSIYYARLYSFTPTGTMNDLEILVSTDHGATFTMYDHFVSPNKYSSFDLLAAGNNASNFGLFIAFATNDSNSFMNQFQLWKYDTAGTSVTLLNESYSGYRNRWFRSIGIVSDYRQKNSNSAPYSLSVAAIKDGLGDTVIVWTDEEGGTNLHRKAVASTDRHFRNLSIAIGTANSADDYGRLGIAYDQYQNIEDTLGAVKATFIYPNNGNAACGPFDVGYDLISCRNPCIMMSQTSGAMDDIRTIIMYEHAISSQILIHARLADDILTGSPDFSGYPIIAEGSGKNLYPYGVYDPAGSNFMITYYNTTANSLTYALKSLSSPADNNPVISKTNYRDASTPSTTPVNPRVDIDLTAMKAVFAWNDNYVNMFDAENTPASITEASPNGQKVMQVYPNPTSDFINIKTTNEDGYTIALYNITGQEVLMNNFQGSSHRLNLQNIPKGYYLLKITSGISSYSEKLIIQ